MTIAEEVGKAVSSWMERTSVTMPLFLNLPLMCKHMRECAHC